MHLKKDELKVFYQGSKEPNEKLEKAIREAIKPFGYSMWASGMCLSSGVRDLAFDKKDQTGE